MAVALSQNATRVIVRRSWRARRRRTNELAASLSEISFVISAARVSALAGQGRQAALRNLMYSTFGWSSQCSCWLLSGWRAWSA